MPVRAADILFGPGYLRVRASIVQLSPAATLMPDGCVADGYVGIMLYISGLWFEGRDAGRLSCGWIVVYADCHYCMGWAEGVGLWL